MLARVFESHDIRPARGQIQLTSLPVTHAARMVAKKIKNRSVDGRFPQNGWL
jgi:hypothetical protein